MQDFKLDINRSLYEEREEAFAEALREMPQSESSQRASRKIVSSKSLNPEEFSQRQPLDMVATGIPSIDHVLGGGVSEGQSIGIGGVYGGGKSILLLQIASNLAKAGASILYATPELTVEEVYSRQAARYADELDSKQSGFNGEEIRPSFGEIRRMRDRDGKSLSKATRKVISESVTRWSEDVGDRFSLLRYKEGDSLDSLTDGLDLFYETGHGENLKVVVIDPIQRLAPMRTPGMSQIQFDSIMRSESERIALVATQVKDLTDDDKTVVLFGSDANGSVTNPEDSASAGFRGGAKVGNAATTMFFIYKPTISETYTEFLARSTKEQGFVLAGNPCVDETGAELDQVIMQKKGITPVVIATFKNREGPGGFIGAHMHGAFSRFSDCARMPGLSADKGKEEVEPLIDVDPFGIDSQVDVEDFGF